MYFPILSVIFSLLSCSNNKIEIIINNLVMLPIGNSEYSSNLSSLILFNTYNLSSSILINTYNLSSLYLICLIFKS